MKVVDRIRTAVGIPAREKSAHGSAGSLPPQWPVEWFQMGWKPGASTQGGSVVEAAVAAYAQTIAMCPIQHIQTAPDGTKTQVLNSGAAKVLNTPNGFQTRSDFLLNLVHSILLEGNGYWVGNGNTPQTSSEIFLLDPRHTQAQSVGQNRDIFYSSGGEFFEQAFPDIGRAMIPQRFVGHVRLFTPTDPLIGVSPLRNAAASVAANNSIVNHQAAFFDNMSRPSGILSTDQKLNQQQMQQLRTAWEDHTEKMRSGGVPILGGGIKWQTLSLSAQDAEMVEAWKMTITDIARVFRVPPMLIGDLTNSTFNNAEALMSFWLASGLGFMINHIESTMTTFFRLPQNERIELDVEVLLRADMQARFAAYGTGVTQGLLAPNEARKKLGYGPVEGGDMPRVQQQMVPLNYEEPEPEPAPAVPAPADVDDTADDGANTGADGDTATEEEKDFIAQWEKKDATA